jgi:hypothetical protein
MNFVQWLTIVRLVSTGNVSMALDVEDATSYVDEVGQVGVLTD